MEKDPSSWRTWLLLGMTVLVAVLLMQVDQLANDVDALEIEYVRLTETDVDHVETMADIVRTVAAISKNVTSLMEECADVDGCLLGGEDAGPG